MEFVFSNLFYIFQSQIQGYVLWSFIRFFFPGASKQKTSTLNSIVAFLQPN